MPCRHPWPALGPITPQRHGWGAGNYQRSALPEHGHGCGCSAAGGLLLSPPQAHPPAGLPQYQQVPALPRGWWPTDCLFMPCVYCRGILLLDCRNIDRIDKDQCFPAAGGPPQVCQPADAARPAVALSDALASGAALNSSAGGLCRVSVATGQGACDAGLQCAEMAVRTVLQPILLGSCR